MPDHILSKEIPHPSGGSRVPAHQREQHPRRLLHGRIFQKAHQNGILSRANDFQPPHARRFQEKHIEKQHVAPFLVQTELRACRYGIRFPMDDHFTALGLTIHAHRKRNHAIPAHGGVHKKASSLRAEPQTGQGRGKIVRHARQNQRKQGSKAFFQPVPTRPDGTRIAFPAVHSGAEAQGRVRKHGSRDGFFGTPGEKERAKAGEPAHRLRIRPRIAQKPQRFRIVPHGVTAQPPGPAGGMLLQPLCIARGRAGTKETIDRVQYTVKEQGRVPACRGDHHVQLRQHDGILAEHAVELIGMRSREAPKLVTVARHAVVLRLHLKGQHFLQPFLGENPFALPHAAAQAEFSQLRHVRDAQVQSPAALFNPHRARFPVNGRDPKRLKQARREVLRQRLSCHLAQDCGQQVAVHAVVVEFFSRHAGTVGIEKAAHPVAFHLAARLAEIGPAGHSEQMAHLHGCHTRTAKQRRLFFREERNHRILHRQQPLGHSHAHRHGDDGFGERKGHMRQSRRIRRAADTCHQLPMAEHRRAVQEGKLSRPVRLPEKVPQIPGGDALPLRRAARQARIPVRLKGRLSRRERVWGEMYHIPPQKLHHNVGHFHLADEIHPVSSLSQIDGVPPYSRSSSSSKRIGGGDGTARRVSENFSHNGAAA